MPSQRAIVKTHALKNGALVVLGSLVRPSSVAEVVSLSDVVSDAFGILEQVAQQSEDQHRRFEEALGRLDSAIEKCPQPNDDEIQPQRTGNIATATNTRKDKRKPLQPRRLFPDSAQSPPGNADRATKEEDVEAPPRELDNANMTVANAVVRTQSVNMHKVSNITGLSLRTSGADGAGPSNVLTRKHCVSMEPSDSTLDLKPPVPSNQQILHAPKKRRMFYSPPKLPCERCKKKKREDLFRRFPPKLAERYYKRFCEKPGNCLGFVHADDTPSQSTPEYYKMTFSETETLPPPGYKTP